MDSGKFRLGTSSWSEKSWVGAFYPPKTAPADMLLYYGTQFDTVEADVTYYRIPSQTMVKNWFLRTPDHFLLSAKFPRSIVHAGTGKTPDSNRILIPDIVGNDALTFLDVMGELKHKCGPLVLQFPYFNKTVFSKPEQFTDRLAVFLDWLPDGFRYAVEIRNRNYITDGFLDILRDHRIPMVWVDLPYFPHPEHLTDRFNIITSDYLYIRLIGDRREVEKCTHTFDRIVVDKSKRLAAWTNVVKRSMHHVSEIFMYANNHFAGHGPDTIRQIRQMLGNDREE
jgi:uncharacterized protein YecE (DUF72 family)